jgi:hypothetical protein
VVGPREHALQGAGYEQGMWLGWVKAPTSTQHASRWSGHVSTPSRVAAVTAYLVDLFTSTCFAIMHAVMFSIRS